MDGKQESFTRCDSCGKPITESEPGYYIHHSTEADIESEAVIDAMVRALRFTGDPEDASAANAYEQNGELVVHQDCYDDLSLPEGEPVDTTEI